MFDSRSHSTVSSSFTAGSRERRIAFGATIVAIGVLVAFAGTGIPTAVAQETTDTDGHVLVIRGETASSAYEYDFSASGSVERLDRETGDAYRFSGEITSFELTGDAVVFIDGERVDPATLGDDSAAATPAGPSPPMPDGTASTATRPTTGAVTATPTATPALAPATTTPPTTTSSTTPTTATATQPPTATTMPTRRATEPPGPSPRTTATSTPSPIASPASSTASTTGTGVGTIIDGDGTDDAAGTIEGDAAAVGTDTTEGAGPGIGALGAVVAMLTTGLLAARRY